MTHQELVDRLLAMGHDGTVILVNPSFDEAIVGVTEEGRLVYSYEKMVRQLAKDEFMCDHEAQEFIDYNTVRAIPYMGEKRPIIVYPIEDQ